MDRYSTSLSTTRSGTLFSHQGVRFIRGFVGGVDELPRRADELGLRTRLAFSLSSYREGAVDLCFDHELYLALIAAVASAVGCDWFVVGDGTGSALDSSLQALRERMETVPEVEREPFEQISIARDERVRALVVSEPWARVGGPDPYHDSYVAAVFCDEGSIAKVEQEARAACEHMGAEVVETIAANPVPKLTIASRVRRAVHRALRSNN